jgi:hypothetical protein
LIPDPGVPACPLSAFEAAPDAEASASTLIFPSLPLCTALFSAFPDSAVSCPQDAAIRAVPMKNAMTQVLLIISSFAQVPFCGIWRGARVAVGQQLLSH